MKDQSSYITEPASTASPETGRPANLLSGLPEFEAETALYRRLMACEDIAALGARVLDLLRPMGFDQYSYILIGMDHKRLDPPVRLLSTWPDDVRYAYDAKHYHRRDIVHDYVFHNQQPVLYSTLQAGLRLTPFDTEAQIVNQDIHRLYRTYGYHDFYIIPLHRDGRIAFLSVASLEEGVKPVDLCLSPPLLDVGGPVLIAESDGLYFLPAHVNGVEVEFLVDTGASGIMLRHGDAMRIGLDPQKLTYNRSYQTVNGDILAAPVRLDSLAAGPIRLAAIPAAVNKADMPHSLLGQSFLRRLSSVEVTHQHMILRP